MRILAIETSCDETGVAIVEARGGLLSPRFSVLSNITASQALLHARYGGVFPMMAKREHAKNLAPILERVLKESGLYKKSSKPTTYNLQPTTLEKLLFREPELLADLLKLLPTIKRPNIDAIAVTHGPGLEPTLWVGINFARALSTAWNIPVIPINHMEGHIFSALLSGKNVLQPTTYNLQPVVFPALALLISGGHTELVLMRNWLKYKIIGETRDDAAGEAFDKVARLLGLPYPGGPEISRLAKSGSLTSGYELPRPMLHSGDFDFSFSGLKTAVLYTLKKISVDKLTDSVKADIAREFEEAVTEVLVTKTIGAAKKFKVKTLILGGGVAANDRIRGVLSDEIAAIPNPPELYLPDKGLTGDNALMIAAASYFRALGIKPKKARFPKTISAKGNLRL